MTGTLLTPPDEGNLEMYGKRWHVFGTMPQADVARVKEEGTVNEWMPEERKGGHSFCFGFPGSDLNVQ
ncbi:Solute Carrier Family 22 Member 6 [Manis pentadactyla]|nr:Solute Carrier Family 22 Member 6 [Manis pentadactyla]